MPTHPSHLLFSCTARASSARVRQRAESAAGATEAAVTDQQQADIDSTRAQVLGLHGPVSAELLEEIDALYAEVRRQRQRAALARTALRARGL